MFGYLSERKPVKILCDTGTQSFILEGILPLTTHRHINTDYWHWVASIRGTITLFFNFILSFDLVCGEVAMSVCPCLLIDGTDIILGNDLARGRVWKNISPTLVLISSPL